jgi:lysozyme family protein
MTDLNALATANAKRWAAAKPLRNLSASASALVGAKKRYQAVEAKTGVPWFIIAVIHMRESSQKWDRSLAQGDPIDRVSVHVPAGRGPFASWEDAAIDALVNCHPYLAKKKNWSLGPALANLEAYNGVGYASGPVSKRNGVVVERFPSQPSPYLWAGTDQYTCGKYVRDGVFDQSHVDTQPGCAALIKEMQRLDPSIKFGMSTTAKTTTGTAGAVVVGGAATAAASAGWNWPEIAAAAFIAAGLVTLAVVLFRKLRS